MQSLHSRKVSMYFLCRALHIYQHEHYPGKMWEKSVWGAAMRDRRHQRWTHRYIRHTYTGKCDAWILDWDRTAHCSGPVGSQPNQDTALRGHNIDLNIRKTCCRMLLWQWSQVVRLLCSSEFFRRFAWLRGTYPSVRRRRLSYHLRVGNGMSAYNLDWVKFLCVWCGHCAWWSHRLGASADWRLLHVSNIANRPNFSIVAMFAFVHWILGRISRHPLSLQRLCEDRCCSTLHQNDESNLSASWTLSAKRIIWEREARSSFVRSIRDKPKC